jgi:hypothetical protein
VKLVAVKAVPPGVVTEMVPLPAAAGTVVLIWVALTTVKVAVAPAKLTFVVAVKLVPIMVTGVPTGPLAGVKLVIVGGGGITVKLVGETAVPPDVVTDTKALTAPVGTVVVICVALATVNMATVEPKPTDVAPVKFVPVMVTASPALPLVGATLVMLGAGGGGGVDEPPPQAANTSSNRTTGISFKLVLNGLAAVLAGMISLYLATLEADARNGSSCPCERAEQRYGARRNC